MEALLTGASGFAGAHMLRYLLQNTNVERIHCPVSFRHRGGASRLQWAMEGDPFAAAVDRVNVFMHDLTGPFDSRQVHMLRNVDVILNIASESHVDRSITDPVPFVRNNVDIMLNVLDLAITIHPELVLHMSTDEVYGPAPTMDVAEYSRDAGAAFDTGEVWRGAHEEWSPILPSNPYSASKAAQEAIAISYWRTYGVPLLLTNTMNLYGETQDPEKFMPKIVRSIREGRPVPIHVDGEGLPGSRHYIHARDFAAAWMFLVQRWSTRTLDHMLPSYEGGYDRPLRLNIVGNDEVDNLQFAQLVADAMGVELRFEKVDFHSSRPGHDPRYALDGSKLAAMGWIPYVPLAEGIKSTVDFSLEHPEWLAQ
jgi:dTDP-glucose 4,6-dehydratase